MAGAEDSIGAINPANKCRITASSPSQYPANALCDHETLAKPKEGVKKKGSAKRRGQGAIVDNHCLASFEGVIFPFFRKRVSRGMLHNFSGSDFRSGFILRILGQ